MNITSKSKAWEIFNSIWILFTFTLCFLNWVAFFFIGFKTKQKKWITAGVIYCIPFILIMVQSHVTAFATCLTLILGIIGIIHGFSIRKEYLIRLEAIQRGLILTNEELDNILYHKKTESLSSSNIEIHETEPKETINIHSEENIEKISDDTEYNLLDINKASEGEIADLPGIGPILAKKAINHKKNSGDFTSIENFCEVLNLKPHVAERIKDLIMVNVSKNESNAKSQSISSDATAKKEGRIVDF